MGLAQAKLLIEAPVNGGRNDNGRHSRGLGCRASTFRPDPTPWPFRIGHLSHPIRCLHDVAECCVFVKQSLNAIYWDSPKWVPLLPKLRG